ncbi:MAG: metalloregulator ArsR/SmtB family transcription factor [Deltaproteobacteria bacterium]|nr:metalloregulator ArsR/SmtB family transcription factor [Deltaproteobacteria bacterium]
MKKLAKVFKSLEDETRLRIMALLLEAGELCVCDLMAVLQLPQSTVSRHLAYLKNAGWLNDRRRGVWIHYSIAVDLSPVHKSVSSALRAMIAANKTVGKDRERLRGLSGKNNCA